MLGRRWRRPSSNATRFVRTLQHRTGDGSSEPPRVFHFKCTQCGKCCTGKGGRVRVNDREIAALQRELGVSSTELKATYLTQATSENQGDTPTWLIKQTDDDKQCIFLKGTKCSVYQARPTQCRTFPWWPQHLISDYDWRLAARNCEGITTTPSAARDNIYAFKDVVPETIVYDIHRSGENYTYDELHAMLRDLQDVEPSFMEAYATELFSKFHRRVVYLDDHVTVLDTFLHGVSPSRCFVFNDRLHLVQSEMKLTDDGATLDPSVLMLDVHRAMRMAFVWLTSQTATKWKVAVLGSGGGSLVRYLLHTHSDAVALVDAVEPNLLVNDVARRFFGLDDSLQNLTLHEAFGEDFLTRQLKDPTAHKTYDVVLIDVEAGSPGDGILAPPLTMLRREFLSGVIALTRDVGIVAINVITDDDKALERVAKLVTDAIASDSTMAAVYTRLPNNTVIYLVKNAPSIEALQEFVDTISSSSDVDRYRLHPLKKLELGTTHSTQ